MCDFSQSTQQMKYSALEGEREFTISSEDFELLLDLIDKEASRYKAVGNSSKANELLRKHKDIRDRYGYKWK